MAVMDNMFLMTAKDNTKRSVAVYMIRMIALDSRILMIVLDSRILMIVLDNMILTIVLDNMILMTVQDSMTVQAEMGHMIQKVRVVNRLVVNRFRNKVNRSPKK